MPVILSEEIILGHPCIPCAGLTRVAIRNDSENKGRSWGGWADTRRKGLKEDLRKTHRSVLIIFIESTALFMAVKL